MGARGGAGGSGYATGNYRMTHVKRSAPRSVEEYIAAEPEAVRPKLEEVRAVIKRRFPVQWRASGMACRGGHVRPIYLAHPAHTQKRHDFVGTETSSWDERHLVDRF